MQPDDVTPQMMAEALTRMYLEAKIAQMIQRGICQEQIDKHRAALAIKNDQRKKRIR